MLDDLTLSYSDLWSRAEAKEAVARAMVEDRRHCRETWVASGFATEFALKAVILKSNGWDKWPSRVARPDLHIHTLRDLFGKAGINLNQVNKQLRAPIRQVLDWERRHDYVAKQMSRAVARSMFEAAFGDTGVVRWLKTI